MNCIQSTSTTWKKCTFVVAATPKQFKESSKSTQVKWEYLEKYYTDYFGANDSTPPSFEDKHTTCKNILSFHLQTL